ncbi:MAG: hypothetical protein ACR2PM_11400 [Hyphomicrobiales bacterium]
MITKRRKRHHPGPPWQTAALLLALFALVLAVHGLSVAAEDPRDPVGAAVSSPHP